MAGSAKASGTPARAGTVALTVAAAVATLLYLFLLLVPPWRQVEVDRGLLRRRLLQADNGSSEAWDWLQRGVQLRSRSANLFRECLWHGADSGTRLLPEVANDTVRADADVWDVANGTDVWDVANGTDVWDVANGTYVSDVANGTYVSDGAEPRCWLLDLRWAEGLGDLSDEQRTLLRCLRALFALALLLLCCYFVAMVAALYACFSSAPGRSCTLALLVTQCALLSLLVGVIVLQDFSRELLLRRLRRRVERLFPAGSASAVAASTGACCLLLLCCLAGLSVLQLLLLLFVSRSAPGRRHGNKKPDDEAEEDTNPLIM